jgi:hypothetical protein
MGITSCNQCQTSGVKDFSLNGQIQVISTLKEVLRQLPINISGRIKDNRMLLFQKVLTPTSSATIFPMGADKQFCFVYSEDIYNMVEQPTLNTYQPNFIYVLTDSPVLVTFGYVDTTKTPFITPGTFVQSHGSGLPPNATPLSPQPKNINNTIVVNGYFILNTYNVNKKVAPTTVAELSDWPYSGNYGGDAGTGWEGSLGYSDASLLFPIKATKIDTVSVSQILIFACLIV